MKFNIDNLDGEHPARVRRRLNLPAELTLTMVSVDANFVVPAAGAHVQLARQDGSKIFTGYVGDPPEFEYLGWGERGPMYRYALKAAGDDLPLDRSTLARRAPLVDRTAGGALKQLTGELAPGALNCDAVSDLDTVPYFAVDAQKTWSQHAAELAQLGRGAYRAHDGALELTALGARAHQINESDASFSPDSLQLACFRKIVNDLTVLGMTEPQMHVKDYFMGDGYTLHFNLSEVPFAASSRVVVDEEYTDPTLRVNRWMVTDPTSAVAVSNGRLFVNGGAGSDGATRVVFVEQVELGGALTLQHGDVNFSAASDGIIGGLYNGAVSLATCLAGFRVTPAGGQTQIAALINGAAVGAAMQTQANHHYVLTTRVYATEAYRREQAFHSSQHAAGNAVGGATIGADVRVVLEVHDIDPNNPPSIVAASTVLYDDVIANAPGYCTYALINSTNLRCDLAFTRLMAAPQVLVRSAQPGAAYRTRLVGALTEGAECRVSTTPELYFFSQYPPVLNEKIEATYRSSGRAMARMMSAASQAAEARPGDNGVRVAVMQVAAPSPRTSHDCENAATALLDDTTQAGWSGKYQAWNSLLDSEFWPGDGVAVQAPSRGAAFTAIVREVQIECADPAGDNELHTILFATDAAEALSFSFDHTKISSSLETPALALGGISPWIADVTGAEVTAVTSTSVTIDAGQDPPAGGGFEVRRSDLGWNPANDRNLIGRYPTRTLSLPRLGRVQDYYLRQYDAGAPPRYSRFSTLLHVDYPYD